MLERLEDRILLAGDIPNHWASLDQIPDVAPGIQSNLAVDHFEAFELQETALRQQLVTAPREFTPAANEPLEVSIPNPDGGYTDFAVLETSVMAPGLAAWLPQVRTYVGQALDDPAETIRFDVTQNGFHAQVLTANGAWYVAPYFHLDTSAYAAYYRSDRIGGSARSNDSIDTIVNLDAGEIARGGLDIGLAAVGDSLRTFDLAIAATAEYTGFFGSAVNAQAEIVTVVNQLNGIYERELAIRFQLVANNLSLIFTDSFQDPFNNGDLNEMISANQILLDNEIGNAGYDVGHVFGKGNGVNDGGLAALEVVGITGEKAQGASILDQPTGDSFVIDIVAHELGHQFGADHTFNGVGGGCTGEGNLGTSVEPGSGSTIMSYAGVCGADDIEQFSDPFFHAVSFEQIEDHIANNNGAGSTTTATGNTIPTVSAGAEFTIPAQTPFVLTATGNDVDGDSLTYAWEQIDNGPLKALTAGDDGVGPLFRTFVPSTSSSRTFPQLSTILSNTSDSAERLPTLSRTMEFRVTTRDNRVDGGGVESDDVEITVLNTGAPFAITSPNAGLTWSSGSTQTVTWNVAGTDLAPIGVAEVNILMSTDGGQTFPIALAGNTANDGSATVAIPNVAPSSEVRLKIEAVGNIFFDISNTDLTVTPSPATNDFGDAPDDGQSFSYATLAPNGANHVATGPVLGLSRDAESDGQQNATANGDGVDEDGVVFVDPLVTGTNANIQVMSSTGGGELNYFIDWDADGTFGNNANENLSATLTGGSETLVVAVPAGAALGTTYARFRLSTAGGLNQQGTAVDGEVEDYLIQVLNTAPTLDFGDAPDAPYATLLSNNGARHAVGGPTLGIAVTTEADATPSSLAVTDADDGVAFPELLTADSSANIQVTSSAGGGQLNYFIDFDQDGTFGNNANEAFSANLSGGTEMISVAVPAAAIGGQTFARFRISSAGGLGATGLSATGEVEDYAVVIIPAPSFVCNSLEHFDDGAVLPAGWASSGDLSWVISTARPNTEPNSAFLDAFADEVSDTSLTSPAFVVDSSNSQIRFSHDYDLEEGFDANSAFDGGVFEMSIAGGGWQDVVTAGGTFQQGGYNTTVGGDAFGSVIIGRDVWSDVGEDISTIVDLPPATVGQSVELRWRFVSDDIGGSNYWSVDTIKTCGTSGGGGGDSLDFGDAPDLSYGTSLANDGARHVIGDLHLGATVDAETDGQATANASGDDNDGANDDDGVVFISSLTAGETADLQIQSSEAGVLSAWIDFNDDGDWSDPNEQILGDVPLSSGFNNLSFAVPLTAVLTAETVTRFRVSSQTNLTPTGLAADGEVEDYVVAVDSDLVLQLSVDIVDAVVTEGNSTTFTVTRNADINNEITVVIVSDNPSDVSFTSPIVIPAGQATSAPITLDALDDVLDEANLQIVQITATASGHSDGASTFEIEDTDTAQLTLLLSAESVNEAAGNFAVTGTVSRNSEDVSQSLVVNMASDLPGEAELPVTVTIPAGQTVSQPFFVTLHDDILPDGSQTVTFTASAATFTDGEVTLEVHDNDQQVVPPTVIAVTLNGSEVDPPDLPSGSQPTSWLVQRSDIKSIQIEFSHEMVIVPGDISLINLGINADSDPDTIVGLTQGQLVIDGNNLSIEFDHDAAPEGVYALEIHASARNVSGIGLDGDANGSSGGSFNYVGDVVNNFYRLTADWSGDTGVSVFDFSTFAYWFGIAVPAAPRYADSSGDGGVSVFDFSSFSGNFGIGVSFPSTLVASFAAVSEQPEELQEAADREVLQRVRNDEVVFGENTARRRQLEEFDMVGEEAQSESLDSVLDAIADDIAQLWN
jgi:hypothetical protein